MQVNQRLYLLSIIQSSGLQRFSLHLIFNALVINKLTHVTHCRRHRHDTCYIKKVMRLT